MYRMVICRGEEWRQRGREADCVVRQARDAGVSVVVLATERRAALPEILCWER